MPCRDYESDWGRSSCDYEKRRLDEYAAMLCASCQLMTDDQINSVKGLRAWWDQHQEDDRIEQERVRKEREMKRKKSAALKKLTPEERILLGV